MTRMKKIFIDPWVSMVRINIMFGLVLLGLTFCVCFFADLWNDLVLKKMAIITSYSSIFLILVMLTFTFVLLLSLVQTKTKKEGQ